jgi:Zn-dependent peptidase ImmA (M78 family)/transcriptional regulator with XRE-family HTH domain
VTTLTPFHVGPRVKYAREKLSITQESLAATLGFKDRQTISDIENGKRAVKTGELLELSDALNKDVEFFLDPFNVVAEAQYAWRAGNELSGAELDHIEALANGWIGMLRWLRRQEQGQEAACRFMGLRMNESSTFEQAQTDGEAFGNVLQLGKVPATTLLECLEAKLDIPVLFFDSFAGVSSPVIAGAACRLDGLHIILVNRRESAFQRNVDLAHELFHVLTWEAMPPDRQESNAVEHRSKVKRVEQLADHFAGGLLMPRRSLDHFIEPGWAADVQHLADVADILQVTTDVLAWRLKTLGRIDESTRVALAGLRRSGARELPKLFSLAFVTMLHAALDKGRVSARKAAKTLGMSLYELTELFHAYEMRAPFQL